MYHGMHRMYGVDPKEPLTKSKTYRERHCNSHKKRTGICTLRKKWKLIGDNHCTSWYPWGSVHNGKYWKNQLNRAYRRQTKEYTDHFKGCSPKIAEEIYYEIKPNDRGVPTLAGEVSWRFS